MINFVLPDGKKIDLDMLIDGLDDNNPEHHYFLNTQTGEVEFVLEEFEDGDVNDKLMEKIDADSSFLRIDGVSSDEKYQWMVDYSEEIIKAEDNLLYEKLLVALNGRGSFRRFKDVLGNYSDGGWLSVWYEWQRDALFEQAKEWLDNLDIEIREEVDFFDNCPACQALKDQGV
ncbi:MAG TPA: UPF0158 family protein [Patescibacteria group bacterium]|nr:UPF0158 family protein [Patescibacteria group bacterium]